MGTMALVYNCGGAGMAGNANADSGQPSTPNYGGGDGHQTRMMSWNYLQVPKRNRQAPSSDQDLYPSPPYRHYTNVGVTDVQINNGLRWRVGAGKRIGYAGAGYMYGVVPQIPGQTRDNAAGFHTRGPSPLNVQAMWNAGPGSQPANPGGPGKIAAPLFYNPMTG